MAIREPGPILAGHPLGSSGGWGKPTLLTSGVITVTNQTVTTTRTDSVDTSAYVRDVTKTVLIGRVNHNAIPGGAMVGSARFWLDPIDKKVYHKIVNNIALGGNHTLRFEYWLYEYPNIVVDLLQTISLTNGVPASQLMANKKFKPDAVMLVGSYHWYWHATGGAIHTIGIPYVTNDNGQYGQFLQNCRLDLTNLDRILFDSITPGDTFTGYPMIQIVSPK